MRQQRGIVSSAMLFSVILAAVMVFVWLGMRLPAKPADIAEVKQRVEESSNAAAKAMVTQALAGNPVLTVGELKRLREAIDDALDGDASATFKALSDEEQHSWDLRYLVRIPMHLAIMVLLPFLVVPVVKWAYFRSHRGKEGA